MQSCHVQLVSVRVAMKIKRTLACDGDICKARVL